eukprot:3559508-Amphidinium_carterae.1
MPYLMQMQQCSSHLWFSAASPAACFSEESQGVCPMKCLGLPSGQLRTHVPQSSKHKGKWHEWA